MLLLLVSGRVNNFTVCLRICWLAGSSTNRSHLSTCIFELKFTVRNFRPQPTSKILEVRFFHEKWITWLDQALPPTIMEVENGSRTLQYWSFRLFRVNFALPWWNKSTGSMYGIFSYTPGSSNIAGWKMDPDGRCISYWKWWYSIAMLVYQRVHVP